MSITIDDINALRKKTGIGLMDCKKALIETNGDQEKAIEVLRKRNVKIALSRSDKEANEGIILATVNKDRSFGAVICLASETDFVSHCDQFQNFARRLSDLVIDKQPHSIDDMKNLTFDDGVSVNDACLDMIGRVKENVSIANYLYLQGDCIVEYNHPGNQLAVILSISSPTCHDEKLYQLGHEISMQIAAMSPLYVDRNRIPNDAYDKEMDIARSQVVSAKTQEIAEKIALGKMDKFFQETVLLDQLSIKDNKTKISDYIKSQISDAQVIDFHRLSIK